MRTLILSFLAAVILVQACDIAVIGAGPGGAYTANRLTKHFGSTKQVCVFESSQRVGGRVHSLRGSGPEKDLVVEAGAYRFATNLTCEPEEGGQQFCIHTPLSKGIILDYLQLPSKKYDPRPASWDNDLSVIVDAQGHETGYLTFVEQLLNQINSTTPVHFNKRLKSIAPTVGWRPTGTSAGRYTLAFADGGTATADEVVLNMPQMPLLRVLAHSKELMKNEAEVPEALHSVVAFPLMKMYVHYSDAWWINELGLRAGTFNNSDSWEVPGPDPHGTCTMGADLPVPVRGSYHDGDVRCDGPGGTKCRGFLQAVYTSTIQATRVYEQYHVLADDGDSVQQLDAAASPEDARILRRVHEALVEVHAAALQAKGVLEKVKSNLPDSAVLSIWDQRVAGIETGCHKPKTVRATPSTVFPDDDGVAPARIPIDAMRPFANSPGIYVANEAWGTMHCFAEGSLVMAENVVHTGFGVPRPSWIDPEVYANDIIFNTTTPSAAQESMDARGWSSHPLGDVHFQY